MAPISEAPEEERIQFKLPNLFMSFLKAETVLNPLYEITRTASEAAVCRECQVDTSVAKVIAKCDFAYFAVVMAPCADEESFRTICDWGTWTFPFDDLFDIGSLRADYEAASKLIDQLLECFDRKVGFGTGQKPPIVSFHNGIWIRVQSAAPFGVQERYAKAMQDYCAGTLAQVRQVEGRQAPTVEDMLALRRSSVCVSSLFVLIEYGHRIELADAVFDAPAIQKLERTGIDLTLMHNDILSYRREETESVPHNLVAVARMQGMSAQAAFDYIAHVVDERHGELTRAVQELPSWGKQVDAEVKRYIQAVKDVVKANLWWSFRSARFLTEAQRVQVKDERLMDVLAEPSLLCSAGKEEAGQQLGGGRPVIGN